MKIYISGSFASRDKLRKVASYLEKNGHTCTSSWLTEPIIKTEDEHTDWEMRVRANDDLLDVERSDAMMLFTGEPSTTGGLFVELGIAMAHRKRVFLCGPKTNVFMYSNLVEQPPEDIQFILDLAAI